MLLSGSSAKVLVSSLGPLQPDKPERRKKNQRHRPGNHPAVCQARIHSHRQPKHFRLLLRSPAVPPAPLPVDRNDRGSPAARQPIAIRLQQPGNDLGRGAGHLRGGAVFLALENEIFPVQPNMDTEVRRGCFRNVIGTIEMR